MSKHGQAIGIMMMLTGATITALGVTSLVKSSNIDRMEDAVNAYETLNKTISEKAGYQDFSARSIAVEATEDKNAPLVSFFGAYSGYNENGKPRTMLGAAKYEVNKSLAMEICDILNKDKSNELLLSDTNVRNVKTIGDIKDVPTGKKLSIEDSKASAKTLNDLLSLLNEAALNKFVGAEVVGELEDVDIEMAVDCAKAGAAISDAANLQVTYVSQVCVDEKNNETYFLISASPKDNLKEVSTAKVTIDGICSSSEAYAKFIAGETKNFEMTQAYSYEYNHDEPQASKVVTL